MQRAGVKNRKHEREDLEELLNAVDDHPLSVELVGPHLNKMDPGSIIQEFRGLLDIFEEDTGIGKHRSLRASLEFSMRRLKSDDKGGAEMARDV
jgi:hypothetical protein